MSAFGRKLRGKAGLRETIGAAKLLMPMEVFRLPPGQGPTRQNVRCSCGHWHAQVFGKVTRKCLGWSGDAKCACCRIVPCWAKRLRLRMNPARQWPTKGFAKRRSR